jgi:hypothetical protein
MGGLGKVIEAQEVGENIAGQWIHEWWEGLAGER